MVPESWEDAHVPASRWRPEDSPVNQSAKGTEDSSENSVTGHGSSTSQVPEGEVLEHIPRLTREGHVA